MKHPPTEHKLQQLGLAFTYVPDFDLATIDRKASYSNQARPSEPVNEEWAIMYAEAMEAGDDFPAILLDGRPAKFIVISGNNRLAALDLLGRARSDAYIVDNGSDLQIRLAAIRENEDVGHGLSLDERLMQAAHLHALGHSKEEAARTLRVPVGRLGAYVRTEEARARATALGVGKLTTRLPDTAVNRLGSLRGDEVFAAAVRLAALARLPRNEVGQVVTKLNRLRNERDQLAWLEGEQSKTSRATGGGLLSLPHAVQTLRRALVMIMNNDNTTALTFLQNGSDAETVEAMRRLAKDVRGVLGRLEHLGIRE